DGRNAIFGRRTHSADPARISRGSARLLPGGYWHDEGGRLEMTSLYGVARRLRVAGYLLALFVAVGSISDIVASTWPISLHDARWRTRATTLITSAMPINLLAIFLCIAIAFLAADRRVLWFIGALCGVATVLYVGLSAE